MPKDYHKGYKLQVYIPEELAELIKKRSQLYETTMTKTVINALDSYLNASACEKSKYYSDKHTI